MPREDSAIEALYAAWEKAFREGDVETIESLVTPDYLLFAPGAQPVGIEALRPRLAAVFAAYAIELEFESEERIVSGDLAFERGWDVQTVRPREGGEARQQRQRVFLVLQRGADGVWRFARGISLPGPAS